MAEVLARRLRVAVTGPTGDIGRSLLRALEATDGVAEVVAMARGAFDPAAAGLRKTEYRRGDVLDRVAVDELVAGADVVVHLAFEIVGGREETEQINLDGARTVFEAAAEAGAARLVYASSAELEPPLNRAAQASSTAAYVLRPCIVAGPDALTLIRNIPYVQAFEFLRRYQNPLTAAVFDTLERFPNVTPVLPDPGTRFQLVHHDDVADAFVAAILGRGQPGTYDLAAPGELTISELAAELGWRSFPVAESALDGLAELVARFPLLPAPAQWIESLRQSELMDTEPARRELGWAPTYDTRQTLRQMIGAAREKGLLELGR